MGKRPGLYANIAAKKARIKAGSKEKMRKKGEQHHHGKKIQVIISLMKIIII